VTADDRQPLSFQRPSLPSGAAIERYLARARSDRWFSNSGPCWRLLRERLATRTGAHCVPVASGTLGLMAAIATLTDPPAAGCEALMPSFTFAATVQAAIWSGLTPRFLDVDPANWQLDPEQLEQELSERRARVGLVVAVTAFGTPAPESVRRRWAAACRAAGVPLLVDSAAAFGTDAIGRHADAEVVSFHATKPFAIGEGGAVFTQDAGLAERIERTINFGLDGERNCGFARGLNGKMSELHAAAGLAVLDTFSERLAARRASAARLRAEIGAAVSWQHGCEHSTWQFVPVAFPDADGRRACGERAAGRIEVRGYYQPLHRMRPFAGFGAASGGLGQTDALAARMLCLPMAADLTDAELGLIAEIVLGRSG
jgi:dTDP-4-amino-4,6-dideoxygalactose transaminase